MKKIICSPDISDIEILNKIRTDKRIYKNILSLPDESLEETKKYFFDEIDYKQNLIIKVNEKAVGYIQLRKEKEKRRMHKASLSIALAYEYQNKGYGTLLMKYIIEIAKNQLGLKKLELTVLQTNNAAIALYKKFGFKIEGLKTLDTLVDEKYESVYVLGLIL